MKNKTNLLYLLLILLITQFNIALAAPSALRQLLESGAGKLLFGDGWRGAEITRALVGTEGQLSEKLSRLATLLEEPAYQTAARQLEGRLSEIRTRFQGREGNTPTDPFDPTLNLEANSNRANILRAVADELFDPAFITSLLSSTEGPRLANFATNARAFMGAGMTATSRASENLTLLRRWALEKPFSDSVIGFKTLSKLLETTEDLRYLFPREAVLQLLTDQEMPIFIANFKKALEITAADTSASPNIDKFRNALRSIIEGKVPADTIPTRIEALGVNSDLGTLRRALGDMTLEETRLMIHGPDPLHPSPESALGRYIAETGAATVIRTFPRYTEQGPERLVVALSEASLPTFLKYLTGETLFAHLHTPNQGTLLVLFRGKCGSYAQITNDFRIPTPGTLLPHVILKPTEGQRLGQYFELGSKQGGYALTPWILPELNGRPYCATGGYSSCTHWVGNMPIGDRLVTEYRFPGAIDGHAHNRVPNTPDPRVLPLGDYNYTGADAELLRRVWKPNAGNEQFADVIGLRDQNLAGELANPGWVLLSLTGPAPVERVPFVILVVQDHRAPIPANFDLRVSPQ